MLSWLFGKTPVQKSEPNMVTVQHLTIWLTGNRRTGVITTNPDTPALRTYRDFYKWYFCRTSEEYFVKCGGGGFLVRRSEIVRFEIEETEEAEA
jgi:hypothetical protein